jgi:hypothetical protein
VDLTRLELVTSAMRRRLGESCCVLMRRRIALSKPFLMFSLPSFSCSVRLCPNPVAVRLQYG